MLFMPMLWNDDNDNEMLDVYSPVDTWNRMWNNFFGDGEKMLHGMKTDVVEEDKDYKMTAELPGFNKEDIHVDLKDGVLTINASHNENKDDKDEKTGRYLRRERSTSSFARSFNVGEEVKPEDVNAKYENGILTLTFPKKEAAVEDKKEDTKRIAIQ